eukprot:PITA_10267
MNLSLSLEKCEFLMIEGTVLGHAISQQGLQVDPNKVAIIQRVPPPQKFDLTIVDKPGKENVVADFFSRVNLPISEEGMVDDQIPDEHLFAISVLSPWFPDIANYLVSAQFPPHLSSKEKSKIVATEEKVAEFLRENIFYKFGYPRELVTDQGSQFTSNLIEDLLTHHKIKHKTSTPSHKQANGHVVVTNRSLEGILTKVVSSNKKNWVDRLVGATWDYNTAWKTTTGFTPYELAYGKKALLSIEFECNTLKMAAQLDLDLSHA